MSEDEILKCVIALMLGYFFAKYFRFGEGFAPSEVMDTSLSELNKAGCCVGNSMSVYSKHEADSDCTNEDDSDWEVFLFLSR